MPARGAEIVAERLERLPGILREQLDSDPPSLPEDLARHGLVATGVGSSEAAARYWVMHCARLGIPAVFRPLACFYSGRVTGPEAPYLFLFTQGLSPNSEIVLRRRGEFRGVVLVSSSSVAGQRAAGKHDRADWLERIREEGGRLVRHPLENEYEILPRFIGPVCAMLEVCRMAHAVSPGAVAGLEQVPALFEFDAGGLEAPRRTSPAASGSISPTRPRCTRRIFPAKCWRRCSVRRPQFTTR